MNRTERLGAILDLLAADGQVEVDGIVEKLGVSPATARRDLDSLANERLLTRTRGGATSGSVSYDLPGRYNRDDHALAKHQIALAASALIPRGAVIGLCGGTTSTGQRATPTRLLETLPRNADLNDPRPREPTTISSASFSSARSASRSAGNP